ncbi:response regulator [Propionivibrio sp.]|uniref:response regulator n=1 Tax=Propionivibrio sp. TaxID=2212460 RepID=UPI003FA71F23
MKILLVDDSRSAAAVFAMRLGEIGHQVIVAENGAIAVEKFRTEAPDLVLMDIEMPVMNGFEATNRIRQVELSQRWAWTPIVFLTSVDTPENFVTSIDAGGDDLIPKNVPEPVLRAKLKAMARVAGLRRELIAANRQMEDDIRARKAAESELSCRLVELTELNQTLSNMHPHRRARRCSMGGNQRQRLRYRGRHPGKDIRSVLHHAARGPGSRTRSGALLRHRPEPRRTHRNGKRNGGWHLLPPGPADAPHRDNTRKTRLCLRNQNAGSSTGNKRQVTTEKLQCRYPSWWSMIHRSPEKC